MLSKNDLFCQVRPPYLQIISTSTRITYISYKLKNAKKKNRLCPLPYGEVLEDIIKTVWTEQCGNLKEMRYLGKAALVYPGPE